MREQKLPPYRFEKVRAGTFRANVSTGVAVGLSFWSWRLVWSRRQRGRPSPGSARRTTSSAGGLLAGCRRLQWPSAATHSWLAPVPMCLQVSPSVSLSGPGAGPLVLGQASGWSRHPCELTVLKRGTCTPTANTPFNYRYTDRW